MLALDLPRELEDHFREVVRDRYDGNLTAAIATFLKLHDQPGWKEQLRQDVLTVRREVQRNGSIDATVIDKTIAKYRRAINQTDG